MRSLVLSAAFCLLAVGCDDDTTSNIVVDMTVGVDLASSCGHPGDPPLNDTGVGKYCGETLDCKAPMGNTAWKALLCSNFGDPTSHFCTFQCTPGMTGQCGTGALCTCNTLGCGCAPKACVPPDAGTP